MKKSKAIVTLAIGETYWQRWQKYCQDNWQIYADKYGYDLICIDKPLDTLERAQARSPAWQKCLVLSQDFSDKYERIVWMDSDILINSASAPEIAENIAIEKVGAVNYWDYPTPELFAQMLIRLYEYNEANGFKYAKDSSAKEYYSNYGLPAEFAEVVQTGVLVLSPKHHREVLERAYYGYEEKGGPEWHYEMRPLSYELLKADCVQWIDGRFNLCFYNYAMLHYPFLLDNIAPDYSLLAANKLPIDLGAFSGYILKKICATTAFINSYFLHFAGCAEEINLVELEATSWRDCRDAKIRANIFHDLGSTYAEQGKVEQAISFFQKSIELKERINDMQGKAKTLMMLGEILATEAMLRQVLENQQQEMDMAVSYLQLSLNIFNEIESPEAEKVREIIAQVQEMAESSQCHDVME